MDVTKVMMMDMGIAAAVAIILPIVLIILWKKKNKQIKVTPFWAGAATFVVFALILEQLCHKAFLGQNSPLSDFFNSNAWAYGLYGALAAGIFEETGRFITMKLFLKKYQAKEDAVTFGIGHGGIEAILVVGFSMLSTIMLMQAITKMGGIDAYIAMVPAEMQDMMRETLTELFATEPYVYLLAAVERVAAITFHIALSVLVFFAATRPGKWYYYPAAIGIHAFMDIFAALYQQKVIASLAVTELLIVTVVAVTAFWVYRLYQKDEGAVEDAV